MLSTPLPTLELLFLLCLCHPQAVSTSPVQLSLQLHLGDAQTPMVLDFLIFWEKEIYPRSDACGYRWDIYPSFSPVGAVGLPYSNQVPASSCRAPLVGVGRRGLQFCPEPSLMSGTSLNLVALLRFAPFCVSANKYCSTLKITNKHEESSKAALGPEFPVQFLSQGGRLLEQVQQCPGCL